VKAGIFSLFSPEDQGELIVFGNSNKANDPDDALVIAGRNIHRDEGDEKDDCLILIHPLYPC
jgi:hypothetical protein